MIKPISLQLYSVRDAAGKDFFGVLKQVADMGYVGVEYAGLHGKSVAEVARVVGDLGLKSSSAHVGMPTKETIDRIAADAEALGYKNLVCGFGTKEFESEDAIKVAAAGLCEAVELARAAQLRLCIHNHWWEFDHDFNGQSPYDLLMAAVPDLCSELDIYWCTKAGQDTAAVVKRYAQRIPLLHVKDGDLGPDHVHKPVGQGKVPVRQIIEAADENTLEWLIVELDASETDMFDAVAQSARWLIDNKLGQGR